MFGEAFRDSLAQEVPFDRSGPAYELVQRAAARVQKRRSPPRRLVVELPWVTRIPAFTVAGRYVYVSRHLVDRCPHEAALAFVIAHEIAHHDLGHATTWARWTRTARRFLPKRVALSAGLLVGAVTAATVRPEQELEADRFALRLCVRSGYRASDCLRLFDTIEAFLLERGDIEGVFGLDAESGGLSGVVERWLWERLRSYPALRERRAALTSRTDATPPSRPTPTPPARYGSRSRA